MSTTNKIIIAILVLLAVVLGAFGYFTANSALSTRTKPASREADSGNAGSQARTVPVVVAIRPLQAGVPIASDDVKLLQYPQQPEGAMDAVAQAVGQVPQTAIGAGVPVLKDYLLSGLSTHVEAGMRAVAIGVDKVIAVGDHLHPGDYVDVFFTLPAAQVFGNAAGSAPAQSRMLLSDLRVLAVGPQTVAKTLPVAKATNAFGPAGQQPQSAAQAPPAPPTSVVLQVPTGEVAKLAMAEEGGKLVLALRNPKDTHSPDASAFPSASPALQPTLLPPAQRHLALQIPDNKAYAGLTLPGLRGRAEPPMAAKTAHGAARAPLPEAEIYRGGQKQAVKY